jgi:hypothetical protein
MALATSDGEWSLKNPKFFKQLIKYYGRLDSRLHGDKQHIDPHFFESVKTLRLYRDKYQHEDFPSETVIFPDFKDFP